MKINQCIVLSALAISLFSTYSSAQVPIFKTSELEFKEMTEQEHLLCDTLYSYYHQFEYEELNNSQKLFFVIPDICQTIWTNGLLVTLTDDYDEFIRRAEFAYSEIGAEDVLNVVARIKEFYVDNLDDFKSSRILNRMDPESELYDKNQADTLDILEADMIDKNCWAWMNLSGIVFDYIKQNKSELIDLTE